MDIDTLLDLFAHMEWADARVWDTAMRSDAACVDETLCWLLLHPLSAQQAFLDAWSGQPVAFRTEYEGVRIADELEAVRAYYPRGRAFLESLTSEELATPMVLPWAQWAEQYIGRPPASTALGETIIQVLAHAVHHRAQANARLRTLGAEPPVVDYIAWLWLERPAAIWPAITVV